MQLTDSPGQATSKRPAITSSPPACLESIPQLLSAVREAPSMRSSGGQSISVRSQVGQAGELDRYVPEMRPLAADAPLTALYPTDEED
jgi:hypothetical protein